MSQTPSSPPPLPPPLPVLPMDSAPAVPPPATAAARAAPAYPTAPPPPVVGRPGVITAIGVISIIVASLGILGGLYGMLSLFAFSFQARYAGMRPPAVMLTPAGPTTAPAPAAAAPANPDLPVSPRGLGAAERAEVASGLAELRFLSGPRVEQLDVLLAKAGQDMFPVSDETPRTSEAVEEMVLGQASGLSANPEVAGPDTFRTRGGRFELYDDRAVFYPNDGEIVRATTLTSTRAGLTPEQVEKVVQQAQAGAGAGMNPSQVAALRTLLATPGQQHVSPITVPTAVRDVQPSGDGTYDVTFPNGWATIGPQGQVVSSLAGGGGAGLPGRGPLRTNGAAMAVSLFVTVVGMGLALYLLVCGILVLRESPRGRRLHLIYAVLKIPVAIAGALAVWWLTSDFVAAAQRSANASASFAASSAGDMTAAHFWMGVLGLVYPVALLIALQMKVVKDYYRSAVLD